MIFVTVGTHEQQFDRLAEGVDALVRDGTIKEKVIMQTGYCTYKPKHCEWQEFFPYKQMTENVRKARIVISHGGPSSFIMPLQEGKIPIVVPRRHEFGEHVNDHQVDFVNKAAERNGNIIVVNDISELGGIISGYDGIIASMNAGCADNNARFCEELEKIIGEMVRR